jgi:hypothetical protein
MSTLSKDPVKHRIAWPVNIWDFKCPACGRVDRWEPPVITENPPSLKVYCDCAEGVLVFNFEAGYLSSKNQASS